MPGRRPGTSEREPVSKTAVARSVTHELAEAIAGFTLADLPAGVLREAQRTLFNVLAVAIGGSRHPGVDAILRVARDAGGTPDAPVAGRSTLT